MGTLNRGGKKHSRKKEVRETSPGNYLIISEGVETEVNYFKNIKQIIESRYRSQIIVDKVTLSVEGLGRSTVALVNEAIKKRSLGSYSEAWVVFDKDDNNDFDEAIRLAQKAGFDVAWSNESFELWLLLHFQTLNSAIGRDDYTQKLNRHFREKGINNGIYDKSIKNIFDITKDYVDVAISRSEKLVKEFNEQNIIIEACMNPCTTVQDLVKTLFAYIK